MIFGYTLLKFDRGHEETLNFYSFLFSLLSLRENLEGRVGCNRRNFPTVRIVVNKSFGKLTTATNNKQNLPSHFH